MVKDLIIRSSSAEFLIFERQKGEKGIEVRFEDGDLWLTQKAIADLFDTSKQDVSYHLKNIFNTLELEENSVVKKYLTTASDNKKYNTNYYNLDAVISIGFRVNSDKVIQFRKWSINVLKEFALSKKWNAEIVNRILRNETYTGTLIQNIKTKPSYKNNKLIDVNKEDWIKTENHHEAIISKDKFDEVQQILDRKIKVNKNNEIDLFSGYLKCFHCGEHLIIRKSKNQVYYYCSSYIKNKSCVKYSINKKKLGELVIEELNKSLFFQLDNLDRKVLSKYINMIYVIDKDNIKIELKKIIFRRINVRC